ncbi:hypothetical protein GCK72_002787 [Caenorhabditis remanei]|uniref:Uncharacterized protein n=1 Tax=Caenorhabditis remanei TaxID=31234 RepID=A0A6A5HX09_CAERE|nr:hypothetical protein GCK72_002787 [Caenorhabditis remanei]KAF1770963.1 hypothetical protein GCK72_002787 [Caenorhabditis remanei]
MLDSGYGYTDEYPNQQSSTAVSEEQSSTTAGYDSTNDSKDQPRTYAPSVVPYNPSVSEKEMDEPEDACAGLSDRTHGQDAGLAQPLPPWKMYCQPLSPQSQLLAVTMRQKYRIRLITPKDIPLQLRTKKNLLMLQLMENRQLQQRIPLQNLCPACNGENMSNFK